MCGCVCVGVLVICVLVLTVFCICTVFLCIRLCIFFLICNQCKDYCHRVTTQLQLVIIIIIITIIIIYASLDFVSQYTIGISLTCVVCTDRRWERPRPVFVQVHRSHDVASVYKWHILSDIPVVRVQLNSRRFVCEWVSARNQVQRTTFSLWLWSASTYRSVTVWYMIWYDICHDMIWYI
jgi:hypothetical protein